MILLLCSVFNVDVNRGLGSYCDCITGKLTPFLTGLIAKKVQTPACLRSAMTILCAPSIPKIGLELIVGFSDAKFWVNLSVWWGFRLLIGG